MQWHSTWGCLESERTWLYDGAGLEPGEGKIYERGVRDSLKTAKNDFDLINTAGTSPVQGMGGQPEGGRQLTQS